MKLISSKTFKRDVTFVDPNNKELTIKGVEFKYQTANELAELTQNGAQLEPVLTLIQGWDSFRDFDDNEIEFSEDIINQLKQFDFVAHAVNSVVGRVVLGLDSKNSNVSLSVSHLLTQRHKKKASKTKRKQSKN